MFCLRTYTRYSLYFFVIGVGVTWITRFVSPHYSYEICLSRVGYAVGVARRDVYGFYFVSAYVLGYDFCSAYLSARYSRFAAYYYEFLILRAVPVAAFGYAGF